MKLFFNRIYGWLLRYIKTDEFKKRFLASMLCIGLLCLLLAIANSEQPIHNTVMEQEVFDSVSASESISNNQVEQTVSENQVNEEVSIIETEYGYLFDHIDRYIDRSNIKLTYTSVPIQDTHNQPLIVQMIKQDNNQLFAVSTNNLKLSVYNVKNELYATIENETNAKVYKVDTTEETDKFCKSLYNDTDALANTLLDIDYSDIKYAGLSYNDNKTYIKMVADRVKKEENVEDGNSTFDTVFAIKPAIEITEFEIDDTTVETEDIQKEVETNEENRVSQTINPQMTGLTSLDSFNVLNEPGHFVFYFDQKNNKLKRLYIRNDNSITTITIDSIYYFELPKDIDFSTAEIIDDDRFSRLMLSSIFAMVSNTELNELTKEIEQDKQSE